MQKISENGLLEIKTATVTAKGQIALPKNMRKLKGYINGERVAILAYPDRIEIRPMRDVEERLGTAIASERSLAKDWLSPADEKAWKDL